MFFSIIIMELVFNCVDKFSFLVKGINIVMWWFGLDVLWEM